MFPYRELFLAVTISLASVVFADVIVQPGYEHSGKNPYSQPALHRINSQTEQYHTKQLPNQEFQYLQNARTVHPYYESKDSSNLVGYPYHPFQHYSPYHHFSPRNHPHYARIGSHGYSRPSVFVGYRQPSIGHWGSPYHHHRYRRSLDSDSTNTESSESANVAHDNDVASKSPLTDDKHPKATDSLLPEQEPTDTNDKHVENRQIAIEPVIGPPRLIGIYPQNIQSPEKYIRENTMQGVMQFYYNPNLNLDENTQENEQDCEDSRLVNNKPSRMRFEQFPKESSNDNYNSKAASPRTTDYLTKFLDNMKSQWNQYYVSPVTQPPTPEMYAILQQKYNTLLQIFKQYFDIQTRQSNPIPFYYQTFSSTDARTKNKGDTSWIPDIIDITRYVEQDKSESYIPLVSDFDQGNYPSRCLNCYTNIPNYSSDNFKDNSDFQRNSNSAYSIEPSISVPNYDHVPNNDHVPNYDPNYAPDIAVVSDYEIHKD
ncbi:PREDICTED: LIM domain-containing protein A-like [Acromyrmex echinatior]|uniref:LIM domain-containing protein A-like n=1 Tax=Acromyrmex echinatior TaxID=103372 RepID=UPI000580C593|nr:PREDICTED: LIM domain-containing protein A-like [Acromyrmex echinatior]